MFPLLLSSGVALTLFVERLIFFREVKLGRDGEWLSQFFSLVKEGEYLRAVRLAQQVASPLSIVLGGTLFFWTNRPERAETEARRLGERELLRLERFLGIIAFIAQLAPLLGLLGTVVGMVELFFGLQNVTTAELKISQLAGGIWQALLTTATGLLIAVPTSAAHLYLSWRVDRFRHSLNDNLTKLFNILPPPSEGDSKGVQR